MRFQKHTVSLFHCDIYNKPGTDNPYFTKAEVDAMLTKMVSGTNGLWDIDIGQLDRYISSKATKFGFTVTQAATVN
jgi:hypothetical protein